MCWPQSPYCQLLGLSQEAAPQIKLSWAFHSELRVLSHSLARHSQIWMYPQKRKPYVDMDWKVFRCQVLPMIQCSGSTSSMRYPDNPAGNPLKPCPCPSLLLQNPTTDWGFKWLRVFNPVSYRPGGQCHLGFVTFPSWVLQPPESEYVPHLKPEYIPNIHIIICQSLSWHLHGCLRWNAHIKHSPDLSVQAPKPGH